jgi:hypothetical protein
MIYWVVALGLMLLALQLAARNGVWGPPDVVTIAGLMGFATVGALIVVRRPDNLIGWIFCVDVVLNAVGGLAREAAQFSLVTQPGALPGAEWLAWIAVWIGDSGWVLLFTFTFLLFPTGRLPSRRWRPLAWLVLAMIVFHSFVAMLRPGPFADWPAISNPMSRPLPAWLISLDDWLGGFVVLPVLASIASLVFRFRAASGEERQQIKWIALVAGVMCVLVAFGALADATGQGEVAVATFDAVFPLALLAFPVAVGISILRHRLLDIDVLIRRTLVYSVVTGLLALAYFASVLVLQPLLARLTGQGTQLATVLSTLFIAGLFVPVRRQVQRAIDRRFYRDKVDAAQTLAAFSAAARDEVDLDHLTGALLDSVGASFQPEHVSLWVPAQPASGGGAAAATAAALSPTPGEPG